jgi:predicted membrane chloride channel (bestrophin family)
MVHGIARGIQGRLNDFNLLLATNADRKPDGTYTRESEKLLEDVSSFSRLFHALFWASCAKRFEVLRTPKGLERMASRGLMTSKQLQILQSLDLPSNQKHNACVEWMMVRAFQGLEDGSLKGGDALYQRLMDLGCQLRGTYASIMDKLSTRMPLAYTHFVQILVDTFIIMAPAALYADLGAYSILCVGILTLFYTGLLDLAKIFLGTYQNALAYGRVTCL